RRAKPRRLVLLLDVSGSMAPYADVLLRFAHAAVRVAPATSEVFTVSTRLTRISRQLRIRDPDLALRAAGAAVPDWSGGTLLGETLRAFLDRWGQRGTARRAVVVIASDGWERGDATLLGEQAARLARLAHAIIWVNPHKGKSGFAPETAGMVAVLPHIDELVAGHSFDALRRVADLIRST
ncbi:MAG TPA: VWA domain-containing protein, partial [Trebonia sp.]